MFESTYCRLHFPFASSSTILRKSKRRNTRIYVYIYLYVYGGPFPLSILLSSVVVQIGPPLGRLNMACACIFQSAKCREERVAVAHRLSVRNLEFENGYEYYLGVISRNLRARLRFSRENASEFDSTCESLVV